MRRFYRILIIDAADLRTFASALLVAGCGLLLSSCSKEPEPTPPDPSNPSTYDVPDSSMPPPSAANRDEPALIEVQEFEAEPDHSIVDLSGRRVFFPGRGWLSAEAFREIYENEPHNLPPDIDFEAAHKLIESMN